MVGCKYKGIIGEHPPTPPPHPLRDVVQCVFFIAEICKFLQFIASDITTVSMLTPIIHY